MTRQQMSFPLISLQMARQSDMVGVMALRKEFGDEVVDIIYAELPHLEQTLAITAHHAEMAPDQFVNMLRRSVDTLAEGEDGDMVASDYIDTVATHLIRLIDPTHESADRRSLGNLLSCMLEQILEDQETFSR